MTLIELLVVIIIITTIVAAAIPIMAPANDDRRVREASRGLNTFITGAQARAIALNRPFGIALKRLGQDTKRADDNAVCLELFYVEQAPPFSGFEASAKARVALYTPAASSLYGGLEELVAIQFVTRGTNSTTDGQPVGWDIDDFFPPNVVRPLDVIEINGTHYEMLSDANDNKIPPRLDSQTGYFLTNTGRGPISSATTIVARPINNSGQQLNPEYESLGRALRDGPMSPLPKPPYWTRPATYKILRQATPTSDEPYQLPEGTAIDLRASGVGSGNYFYNPAATEPAETVNNSQGVLIMFAPEGRVARVSYSRLPGDALPFDTPVVDNVYLLLGKRENVAPAAGVDPTLNSTLWIAATTDEQRAELRKPINWLSGTSRWVAIGSQSGRVVTIENAFVDPGLVLASPPRPFDTANERTEELRSAQIVAAREFTREMAQLGGR